MDKFTIKIEGLKSPLLALNRTLRRKYRNNTRGLKNYQSTFSN